MLTSIVLYGLMILAVSALAWCWQPPKDSTEPNEPTEFSATFDALQTERDEAAKIKARAQAHERAMLAADAAVIAKYGRQHAPVEL